MQRQEPHSSTLKGLYEDFATSSGQDLDAVLDQSLDPRGPEMLFDMAAELGFQSAEVVLDAGCRDGRYSVQLAERFGCRVIGVDLIEANLQRRHDVLSEVGEDVGRRASFVMGDLQALAIKDNSFDLIWNRDVMIHVPDLAGALRELRRVLRPGGRMLMYQMFATPWLSEGDAARLWPPLAGIGRNADPGYFEGCAVDAGWQIERVDEVKSEWREHAEESGERRTSRQLLHAARLLRRPEKYLEELGRASYDGELGNALWGVYQMIGKLSPRVYVLA